MAQPAAVESQARGAVAQRHPLAGGNAGRSPWRWLSRTGSRAMALLMGRRGNRRAGSGIAGQSVIKLVHTIRRALKAPAPIQPAETPWRCANSLAAAKTHRPRCPAWFAWSASALAHLASAHQLAAGVAIPAAQLVEVGIAGGAGHGLAQGLEFGLGAFGWIRRLRPLTAAARG
jgi:hypothetical protein